MPEEQRRVVLARRERGIPDHGNAPLYRPEVDPLRTRSGPAVDPYQNDVERSGKGLGHGRAQALLWETRATAEQASATVASLMESNGHILAMVERNNAIFERECEDADRSTGKGHRCPVWNFTSELKGHAGFRNLESFEAVRIVDEILSPHGGWSLFPDHNVWGASADPRAEFIRAWPTITKPKAPAFAPADALHLAERWPLTSEKWPSDHDAGYRRSVSVVFWYAYLLGDDGRFFISFGKLGEVLGKSHQMAGTYLKTMIDDDLLKVEEEPTSVKATRYRFDLDAVALASNSKVIPLEATA